MFLNIFHVKSLLSGHDTDIIKKKYKWKESYFNSKCFYYALPIYNRYKWIS